MLCEWQKSVPYEETKCGEAQGDGQKLQFRRPRTTFVERSDASVANGSAERTVGQKAIIELSHEAHEHSQRD